jgi:UrcA family protein
MKTLALAAAALGLAVTATPAFADNSVVRSTQVSTAGLDLATPEGQEMLDRRVQSAAREVCGFNEARTGTRLKLQSPRSCYVRALNSAKDQVAIVIAEEARGG